MDFLKVADSDSAVVVDVLTPEESRRARRSSTVKNNWVQSGEMTYPDDMVIYKRYKLEPEIKTTVGDFVEEHLTHHKKPRTCLCLILSGKYKKSGIAGWQVRTEDGKYQKIARKCIIVVSRVGNDEERTVYLADFAREHGVASTAIKAACERENKVWKGWNVRFAEE